MITPDGLSPDTSGVVRAVALGRRMATSGSWVLRDCSLDLPPGSLTAIVGPSGAGKTSLMYCLSGLDRPDTGRVVFDDAELYQMSRQKRATFLRTRVGFVFQQYNLIPYLTVADNVTLPLSLAGRRVDHDQLSTLLDQFGLVDKRGRLASVLSGGEQQRAALCRAMLLAPSVIFADEPTGALDTANSRLVLDILRDLTRGGTTVVMVTHDVDAAATADRIAFMRDGSITSVSGRLAAGDILDRMRRAAPTSVAGGQRC